MASNVDILTRAHSALRAKARAKKNQIESIVFDEDARLSVTISLQAMACLLIVIFFSREFLTGFRKRKLQKKEAAKKKAKEREREERLQLRKEHRKALRERAQENARQVESSFKQGLYFSITFPFKWLISASFFPIAYIKGHDSDESDDEATELAPLDKGKGKATQEFEDEEQLATVTIVEEFDPDALRLMPSSSHRIPDSPSSESEVPAESSSRVSKSGERDTGIQSTTRFDEDEILRRKKDRVRRKKTAYETKAARKAERSKQRARKLEKANLADQRARRKGDHGGKWTKKSRR